MKIFLTNYTTSDVSAFLGAVKQKTQDTVTKTAKVLYAAKEHIALGAAAYGIYRFEMHTRQLKADFEKQQLSNANGSSPAPVPAPAATDAPTQDNTTTAQTSAATDAPTQDNTTTAQTSAATDAPTQDNTTTAQTSAATDNTTSATDSTSKQPATVNARTLQKILYVAMGALVLGTVAAAAYGHYYGSPAAPSAPAKPTTPMLSAPEKPTTLMLSAPEKPTTLMLSAPAKPTTPMLSAPAKPTTLMLEAPSLAQQFINLQTVPTPSPLEQAVMNLKQQKQTAGIAALLSRINFREAIGPNGSSVPVSAPLVANNDATPFPGVKELAARQEFAAIINSLTPSSLPATAEVAPEMARISALSRTKRESLLAIVHSATSNNTEKMRRLKQLYPSFTRHLLHVLTHCPNAPGIKGLR